MNDCIRWGGTIDRDGYGRRGGRLAHRVAYEKAVGTIPPGLEPWAKSAWDSLFFSGAGLAGASLIAGAIKR